MYPFVCFFNSSLHKPQPVSLRSKSTSAGAQFFHLLSNKFILTILNEVSAPESWSAALYLSS